jgi:hypothetical protein
LSVGAKRYAAVPTATGYATVVGIPVGGPGAAPIGGGAPGMGGPGMGTPGGGGPGIQNPGPGSPGVPAAGGLANMVVTPITIPGTPSSSAQQVTLFGRVAQSLATRTGVSVDVSHRRVFGEVPPALVATPARFFDDGVYDDPYASRSTLLRATLKSIVGPGLEVIGSGSWQDKPYGATPAFDQDGRELAGVRRDDDVVRAMLGITVPVLPSRTGAVQLGLLAGYDFTRHRSTTAIYNYTSHALGFGISFSY